MRAAVVSGTSDKPTQGPAGASGSKGGPATPSSRLEPEDGLEPRDGFADELVADGGPRGGCVSSCGFEPRQSSPEAPIAPLVSGGGWLGAAISCSFDPPDGLVEGRIDGLHGGVDKEDSGTISNVIFPKGSPAELVLDDPLFPPAGLICAQLAPIGGRWTPVLGIVSLGLTALPEDRCLFPLAGRVISSAEPAKGSCGPSLVLAGTGLLFETVSVLLYGC